MNDIVTTLREAACLPNTGCMSLRTCVCDVMEDAVEEIERLRERTAELDGFVITINEQATALEDEIERLNKALKWEQDRSGRVGTHSPGCWTWGHQHYQCAIQHIAALDKELESAALIVGTVREDLKDNEGMLDEAVKEVDELKEEVRRLRVEAGYD